MKKTLYFISLFSLLLLSACGSEDNPAGSRTVKAVAVSALQIDAQPVAGTSSYSGTVEALEEVQLSTRISGWVEKVYVSEGQPVRKGQTLVKLRSDDLEAKRSQAEASIAEADVYYQNAATNLKRIEALFKNGAATRKELDDMQSAFASAEARRRTAYEAKKEVEAILSYSILKAPFDGVVTAKFADEGDLANPGQTIVEVENLRQLKITAKVPETEVGSLTTGMPVLIQVSASAAGAPLKGTIDQIVPSADPLSRQFDIKVLIKEPGQLLKPGMFARVSIAGKADRTLLIPREAVFLRGQLEGIYVVDDQNIARLRWIRSGSIFGNRVEVLSGLNPGETIVTAGMANLLDGQPVEGAAMKIGIAGRLAKAFIDSKLTPLLIVTALLIGVLATYLTPREEEPQIVVPMVDIFVPFAGSSAKEVEERVTKPLERVINEIPGVEYVYSTSRPDFALVTARYYVGDDAEESLVKLWSTMMKHMDKMPRELTFPPLIKIKSIDDVPVLTLTLWSEHYDGYQLRRIGAELSAEIKKVSDVSELELTGGQRRKVRIILDQERMRAYQVDPLQIAQQIEVANQNLTVGNFQQLNREYLVETGDFLTSMRDVENLVVGVFGNNPVYLRNVADIEDGPEEIGDYVFFGYGTAAHRAQYPALADLPAQSYPAVTLAIAKRKGADAMAVADKVLQKTEALKGRLIPSDVHVVETRNYGKTASEKVNTLLEHLIGAIVAVTIIVGLFLGWRGGLVVFASVPITFALTLFVYYLFDYTLNRVTLFALIFVTGIVVDDSIIIAENLHRHFSMRRLPKMQAALAAIGEVGNPTILATFTVIASVLPMIFVSGLMGPYMSPMPIGASLAMLFSLMVALIATPWLAYRLLQQHGHTDEIQGFESSLIYRFYDKTLRPLLDSPRKTWIALGVIAFMLLLAVSLLFIRVVEVKMLPFDNKSEIQVIIDMPEGSTLEQTAAAAHEMVAELKDVPEVHNYQYYVGTYAPINFNGLVRHYYLRHGANMADIQLNLLHKSERDDQSHDIARRIRPGIRRIADKYGARVKIAEVPPGPPVLSTLVAEVYGPDHEQQMAVAQQIRDIFQETPGVVDVDWMVEDDQTIYNLKVDKEKAALSGVNTRQLAHTMRIALNGADAGLLHVPTEIEPLGIELRLGRAQRSSIDRLGDISVRSQTGQMIPVSDLVTVEARAEDKSIFRKNLRRVIYVTGDVAGEIESPVYAMLDMDEKIKQIQLPQGYAIEPMYKGEPFLEEQIAMKWDGEWQITYEVFRDLGAAFAVVLVIIYLLIIGWFQSFKVPLVMMVAIPLSLVGIIPGHWLHGAFFTATSMIGMIALAGIMVRNSILIIDFVQLRLNDGVPLKQAVLEAGAVRTRPILLTAGTVVIGAIVILFDPIFQGLAIALMWGAFASTVLTLGAVPLVYFLVERKNYPEPAEAATAAPEAPAHEKEPPAVPVIETAPDNRNDEESANQPEQPISKK